MSNLRQRAPICYISNMRRGPPTLDHSVYIRSFRNNFLYKPFRNISLTTVFSLYFYLFFLDRLLFSFFFYVGGPQMWGALCKSTLFYIGKGGPARSNSSPLCKLLPTFTHSWILESTTYPYSLLLSIFAI